MADASFPVDVLNPGQVFACLGFLEAAEALVGDAEGGFDWSKTSNVLFVLSTKGQENPVAAVLEFLATETPRRSGPIGYSDPPPKKGKIVGEADAADDDEHNLEEDSLSGPKAEKAGLEFSETFPAREADRMSLPIRLGGGNLPVIELGHWADGSSRNSFKLYAGNRSAAGIARAMLLGVHHKPKKDESIGALKTKGIRQLWEGQRDRLIAHPLEVLTPMGGSFNFDPRGAWTAIDAGYSPNDQGHQVAASPVVEFLAAWGLENARPDCDARHVRYAVWGIPLPPIFARAALCGATTTVPLKYLSFELDLSGKNKVVTFAEPETPT